MLVDLIEVTIGWRGATSVILNRIWSKFQPEIEYEATMSSVRFEEKSPRFPGKCCLQIIRSDAEDRNRFKIQKHA
jgi:hypothetical protein